MLIFACRRRRHAKATSKVMVSNFAGAGGHPQTFPSWQEAQQTPFGPGATSMGWYQPAQGTPPSDQAKSTAPPDQAQRTTPSEQMPSTTPLGGVQRTPPSDQVRRPAPASQVQRVAPPGQAQSTPLSGEVQSSLPSSQAQRTAPPGQAQSTAPSGRTQSTSSLLRTQEQGAPPPPRRAHTKGTPSVGASNGMDQSPPPYYPVSQKAKTLSCALWLVSRSHNLIF